MIIGLSACTYSSAPAPVPVATPVVDATAEPALVATDVRPSVFLTAEVEGELSVVGGCFGLDDTAVLFPVGTTRTSDGLDIPGVGAVGLGEQLAGGGGSSSLGDSADTDVLWDECELERDAEVAHLNPFDSP